MRLGRDMILFTKKGGQRTIVMLSRTFLTAECIDDVRQA